MGNEDSFKTKQLNRSYRTRCHLVVNWNRKIGLVCSLKPSSLLLQPDSSVCGAALCLGPQRLRCTTCLNLFKFSTFLSPHRSGTYQETCVPLSIHLTLSNELLQLSDLVCTLAFSCGFCRKVCRT